MISNGKPLAISRFSDRTAQDRKQHHRPLRKIENARGFEDQHKAERDQRVEHSDSNPPIKTSTNGPRPSTQFPQDFSTTIGTH